ncbi:MAG: RNA polymerase sigma factor [Muribaculaceae bacterium]|nr:RNA polymerase sigma factor [Muribaculaceae bacterium]
MEEDRLTSTFRRISERLRLSARKLTGTSDDADDALQEAFFRLWKHRQTILSHEQAERMLYTSVRNAGIDILRRRSRFVDAGVPETADDDGHGDRDDLFREVTALIDKSLSDRDRQILYERDRFGWEIADIAAAHGTSEANVRMILSRARKHIRELYRQRQNNEI